MVGLTRFEDRRRYPHGISVNFTSFAAKLLAQVGTHTHWRLRVYHFRL